MMSAFSAAFAASSSAAFLSFDAERAFYTANSATSTTSSTTSGRYLFFFWVFAVIFPPYPFLLFHHTTKPNANTVSGMMNTTMIDQIEYCAAVTVRDST